VAPIFSKLFFLVMLNTLGFLAKLEKKEVLRSLPVISLADSSSIDSALPLGVRSPGADLGVRSPPPEDPP